MPLDVELISTSGVWLRHAPAGVDPSARPDPPSSNRWQRGEVVDALYLCADEACVWAEWYRHLGELGIPPRYALPRDLWSYELDPVDVADLTDTERLAKVGLPAPTPGRHGWPAFQSVGERLYADGVAGLIAPSAARPQSVILCLFLAAGSIPPVLHTKSPPKPIDHAPPPPTGMNT